MRRLSNWFMGALTLLPFALLAWFATATLRARLHPLFYSILIVAALVALHYGLSYTETRGWIYYRKRRGSYGGLGVTSEWLNMYDPSRKHVQQAVRTQEWKREEDDDGDGTGDDRRNRGGTSKRRTGTCPPEAAQRRRRTDAVDR